MLSYDEFMKSEGVSRFHCGRRSQDNHRLGWLFGHHSSDSTEERIVRLKKMLSKSKTGRQALDVLNEKKRQNRF